MTRAVAIAILLGVVIVLIALIQRAPQPNLPLVEAIAPGPDAKSAMLFAPCPLAPWNAPPPQEREA